MDEKRKIKIIRVISQFISTEVDARKSKGVVIGMSGGVDSSVAACLAVKALGAEKVFGLILHDSSVTSRNDIADAENIAKKLRIKYKMKKNKKLERQRISF